MELSRLLISIRRTDCNARHKIQGRVKLGLFYECGKLYITRCNWQLLPWILAVVKLYIRFVLCNQQQVLLLSKMNKMNNKHLTCDIFSLYTDPDADKDGQTDEQSNNEEGQGNKTIVKFMV